jgi:hypothetical protein
MKQARTKDYPRRRKESRLVTGRDEHLDDTEHLLVNHSRDGKPQVVNPDGKTLAALRPIGTDRQSPDVNSIRVLFHPKGSD